MRFEQWAPVAGLNAIFNANQSINAGYAVDTFRLDVLDEPKADVVLEADLAVRIPMAANPGWILRHVVGQLEEISIIDID